MMTSQSNLCVYIIYILLNYIIISLTCYIFLNLLLIIITYGMWRNYHMQKLIAENKLRSVILIYAYYY